MLRLILLGLMGLTTPVLAASGQPVSQAASFEEFSKQFCSAKRDAPHVFVVPSAVFSENKSVKCEDGESQFRMSEPSSDPGHAVFNIDPPKGSKASFDCDGKADIGMKTVAINCFPVSMETKSHPKN